MMYQMNLKSLNIPFFAVIMTVTLLGCSNFKLSKPPCGTGSPGNVPEVRFPEFGSGCYEMPGGAISGIRSSSNVFPMSAESSEYAKIDSVGNSLQVATSGKLMYQQVNLCADEMDSTGHSFILAVRDQGAWAVNFMTFTETNDILLTETRIDLDKLKGSGLPYAILPTANFKSLEKVAYANSERRFNKDISTVLIDNHAVTFSELRRSLDFRANEVYLKYKRVSDDHCNGSAMKRYTLKRY